MAEAAHVFDTLREWEVLSDDELHARFNADAKDVVTGAVALLMDKPVAPAGPAAKEFPEIVRELNRLLVTGSRALGDAIIQAGELADTGHKHQAAEVYTAFLNGCRSPFYRRIALSRLQGLGNADGRPLTWPPSLP
jgi:hypothetical protein